MNLSSEPLPIDAALPELRAALATHSNVVLQAPPGAGKSTRVPLALLEQSWLGAQKIVMLEPRRLAARAVATRMADTLGEAVGSTVGYRTRLETRVSDATRIEVVTEGILTRWLQHDAALEGVGIVIFDEFHERSLNADLGLALCLDAQGSLREELKILVMSATLDGSAVAALLDRAPLVSSIGRSFPVETHWIGADAAARAKLARYEMRIEERVANTIARAIEEEPGDVLVFLPGQAEIRRTQSLLEQRGLPGNIRVFPLYGDLSLDMQDAAIKPSSIGHRKIVLATNIAETSLTIEGIRVVIDSGLVRRSRFDPASGMSRLETTRISLASADQRRGRAGRLESGVCYRLWSESEQTALRAHTPPEIVETDLAPLALELANWGVPDPLTLRWLDPPPPGAYAQACDLLRLLGAIGSDGRITTHGRQLVRLGTHPRLAHMIVRGGDLGLQHTAVQLAALLGERDLLRFAGRDRNVDLRLRIDALRESHNATTSMQIDGAARQRIKRTVEQLQRQIDRRTPRDAATDADVGRLLAFAYPDRIAQSRGAGGRFLLAGGKGALLPEAQSLARFEFLVVADLEAGEREALIRLAAPIAREALESDFADAIERRERIEWEPREQAVIAQKEVWLRSLKLSERRLERPDPTRVLEALISGIREMGLNALPWSKEAKNLQQRIIFARNTDSRQPIEWPDMSDTALLASVGDWLAPWLTGMNRREHLARLDMYSILLVMIDWQTQQRLNAFAPTHLVVPSGSRIPINYDSGAPTVSVRLQEVFGLQQTPTIGDGRVPLTIELLSPARRPVQITQDLRSFWARGYTDVKKDLKGRYPKHHWPDDPLTAEATARAKARKQ